MAADIALKTVRRLMINSGLDGEVYCLSRCPMKCYTERLYSWNRVVSNKTRAEGRVCAEAKDRRTSLLLCHNERSGRLI